MNLDQHLIEVNILHSQSQAFADPHPAALLHGSIAEVGMLLKPIQWALNNQPWSIHDMRVDHSCLDVLVP